jgi:CHAT domain-containing protein
MIASHEVVNLPSLSTIAILRSRPANRYVPGREVAVLADPVFQRDDPRISAQSAIPGGHMTPQAALGLDSSLRRVDKLWLRLPRLPATRKEAAAVSRFAPSGTAKIALDFDASRTTALSDELKSFRILHFATHSLVSVDQPDESGIVLSLFDSTGNPRNGYLSLRDIYDMRLSADLVVLSACDTALGKNIRGEGIVSLARGFMYAGSSRLIATLWKVDDEATFEFMQQFYKSLFQGRLTPAAALREAQIAVSLKARWHSPYYWAAFVLEGEWR